MLSSLDTRTDLDGRFVFPGVPPGRFGLAFEDDAREVFDCAPPSPFLYVPRGESKVQVTYRLNVRHRLEGRVSYPDGSPVVGAFLSIGHERETLSAADGSFCLPGLSRAVVQVSHGSSRQEVAMTSGAPGRVVLERGADVWVQLARPRACFYLDVVTKQNENVYDPHERSTNWPRIGPHRIENLRCESGLRLRVWHYGLDDPHVIALSLRPGDRQLVPVPESLPEVRSRVLRIQVVNDLGQPLAGAEIHEEYEEGTWVTDRSGVAVIEQRESEESVGEAEPQFDGLGSLYVRCEGYATADPVLRFRDGRARVVLDRESVIVADVRDSTGAPIEGLDLRLEFLDRDFSTCVSGPLPYFQESRIRTEPRRRAERRGLRAGKWRWRLEVPPGFRLRGDLELGAHERCVLSPRLPVAFGFTVTVRRNGHGYLTPM